jgi:hypothetical protein
MSQLRHKFRIVLDDQEHIITTSARDMANADIAGEGQNDVESTFRLLHAACVRLDIPNTPSDWASFADVLDDMEDLEPQLQGKSAQVNPTLKRVSGG